MIIGEALGSGGPAMMSYHCPAEEDRRRTCVDDVFSDIHVCFWEGKHCQEWASHVCRKRGIDTSQLDLRGFGAENGITLQELSRQGFCTIVGQQYGSMFWKELRSYRAMQKHRCPGCVSNEDKRAMTTLTSTIGIQEMASDLSYSSHMKSRSRQSSPSPRLPQEYMTSYPDQLSPVSYEVTSRYPEEHSPPRSCEGSLSPGFQERIMSPEVYSHPPLPPTPESLYRGPSHSPQQMYGEHIYRKVPEDHPEVLPRIRKPLPELLPLEDEDGFPIDHETHSVRPIRMDKHSRISYEHGQSNPPVRFVYASHPSFAAHSNHPEYIVHQSHRERPAPVLDGHQHGRLIQYAYPPHSRHPGYLSHPAHRNHVPHIDHSMNASANSYESDDDDDGQDEPGRLVIDIRDEATEEEHGSGEMEAGDARSGEEPGTFPHLRKIPTKRKRDRGPKSWEFLMRLLACPKSNPSVIKWEDEQQGSFRLVQPQEIANMWGTRSNKDDLKYNNFARALRYHYKTKLLYKISERQLVYGCGPVALDFYNQLLKDGIKSSLNGNTG